MTGMVECSWRELGLKVGLEIHQQLATKNKLFCMCPTTVEGDEEITFRRKLRPARSELGEVDIAAYFEWKKGRTYEYHAPKNTTCLVEADEEPPHPINTEALLIALGIAKALNSTPVDEVHVMRKIVIDGSNTTGFQRTALVALGGSVEVEGKTIRIQTVCLEEDAARKIGEEDMVTHYGLERLGVPLIEISTAPDMETPEEVERVAFKIGQLLRLTGRVRRGIGTIRQDLNISIKGGAKVEVKGVQELRLLPKVVYNEAVRQLKLLEIKDELRKRGLSKDDIAFEPVDVTEALKGSKSSLVKRLLSKPRARAYAVKLPKMRGILGTELQPNKRFGTEVADYARFWGGVAGLIHRDELPGYGIAEGELNSMLSMLHADESDSFIMVIDEPEKALNGLKAAIDRIKDAFEGVPRETRAAEPDGTTRFMRPQPGAARMYPETDIPPLEITSQLLLEAEKCKPLEPEAKLKELIEAYGLSRQLAEQVLLDEKMPLIEELMRMYHGKIEATVIASTLTGALRALKREGCPVENLQHHHFEQVFDLIAKEIVSKEAVPDLLGELAKNPSAKAIEVVEKRGLRALSREEVESIISAVIEENLETIRSRGKASMGLIVGRVMSKVRGRVDGKLVAEIVKKKLEETLKGC